MHSSCVLSADQTNPRTGQRYEKQTEGISNGSSGPTAGDGDVCAVPQSSVYPSDSRGDENCAYR